MHLDECFGLMKLTKEAQKDPRTPIGAAYSLQQFLGKEGFAITGEDLPDGRSAIYAQSDTREIPTEHCGFTVINTGINNER